MTEPRGTEHMLDLEGMRSMLNQESVRLLLRDVFRAAGGTHDDIDEYDRAMADDARLAVFVAPERILGVAP